MLTLKRHDSFRYSAAANSDGYLNPESAPPCLMWRETFLASTASAVPGSRTVGSFRIPGEYRHTGPLGPLGCHDCLNHQLHAEFLYDAYDYASVPGLAHLMPFSLQKLYDNVYPGWTHRLPTNGKYYGPSEDESWMVGVSPINIIGAIPTPSGIRGNYAPVLSGIVGSGFVHYVPSGYGVTSIYVRSVQPVALAGRICYFIQSASARVDNRGHLRGSTFYGPELACPTPLGTLTYNGTLWCLGGTLPESWFAPPSLERFWSIKDTPLSDPYGILNHMVTNVGLPPAVVDSYTLGTSEKDSEVSDLLRYLGCVIPRCAVYRPIVSDLEWSDLCDTAVDNCRAIDINGIAFLRDFISLGRSIVQTVHGDFSSLPSSLENFWLSIRYGLTLTLKDFKSLGEAVLEAWPGGSPRSGPIRVRSRASVPYCPSDPLVTAAHQQRNVEVFYTLGDDQLLNTIRRLMDWDVWPTLQNDWDLIPFSFVVDWAADIEACCDHLDRRIYEEYIQVQNVIYTTRDSQTLDPSALVCGEFHCLSCEYVSYVRHQAPYIVFSPLRVQRGHSSAINAVDGAALIRQITR